jgi:hypothetical protein
VSFECTTCEIGSFWTRYRPRYAMLMTRWWLSLTWWSTWSASLTTTCTYMPYIGHVGCTCGDQGVHTRSLQHEYQDHDLRTRVRTCHSVITRINVVISISASQDTHPEYVVPGTLDHGCVLCTAYQVPSTRISLMVPHQGCAVPGTVWRASATYSCGYRCDVSG